ncbi:hypothetical protein GCK32_021126, partial [Trichostrongylus colubriformis]
ISDGSVSLSELCFSGRSYLWRFHYRISGLYWI